jgi:hypothetical protein
MMKRISTLVILLTLTAVASAQQPAARKAGTSITGRVTIDGGQAAADASILAMPVNFAGNQSAAMASVYRPITTDADGKFEITNLSSVAYTITVVLPGYVVSGSREERYYRPGDTAVISMVKGGVITGRVTNFFGEAVVGARVRAIRVKDSEGRAVRSDLSMSSYFSLVTAMMGEWRTDDRGVYRIYGLEPGYYHVAAGGRGMIPFSNGGYDSDAPTYYPSGTLDTAADVRVGTGDEMTGIDIRYRDNRGFSVSGTVTGRGEADLAQVVMTNVASGAIEGFSISMPGATEKGFIFNSVPEGEYYLTAIAGDDRENGSASQSRRVVVKGADITGIELTVAPLGSISGRVVVEQASGADLKECKPARPASIQEVALLAKGVKKDRDEPDWLMASYSTSAPDDKGEFTMRYIDSGQKRLVLKLPGENWYVRTITLPAAAPAARPVDAGRDGFTLKPGTA